VGRGRDGRGLGASGFGNRLRTRWGGHGIHMVSQAASETASWGVYFFTSFFLLVFFYNYEIVLQRVDANWFYSKFNHTFLGFFPSRNHNPNIFEYCLLVRSGFLGNESSISSFLLCNTITKLYHRRMTSI
jgi:hypothetical protein